MAHIHDDKNAILVRIKKIRGQTNAIEKALEDGSDCVAVLQQVAAIRGAVNGLMNKVLEDHIRQHIGQIDLTKEERESEVEALISILSSYLK
ncbi:metal/formaldehyde-sensitive transcriptional repressor [Thalassotalea hakodatensis]|jgi:DNA-binding FrmR family transcriptional regulator|uniref:metal/formaldehyde-sensitive transcriptional repressor n=1 Tax=Thalassotalea hakodatensis TaxID=3030492 RepID=UPI0025735D43|nr:metal/formaldehyde-sensitive transcriptional repressor [Thalassotalea hakodatensis]